MTSKRPLTLTVTNGNRSKLRVAPVKEVPEPTNRNRFGDRMAARADLCVVFAGLKGVDTARQDILETLNLETCLLYTSPSPRDLSTSRMPSSA